MDLSNNLISQFVKITNDNSKKEEQSKTCGKVVIKDDETYVQLDGSNLLSPANSTVHVKDGERVTVTIKNHSLMIDGNLSDISASNEKVITIDGDIGNMSDVIDYMFLDTNENIDRLDKKTSDLEDTVNELETTIDDLETTIDDKTNESYISDIVSKNITTWGLFHYIHEGEIEINVCGTGTVQLPTEISGKVKNRYLVSLAIKTYNFGDGWTNIITQQSCVYVTAKNETSFVINTFITGVNITDGSQITTGTATVQYTILA